MATWLQRIITYFNDAAMLVVTVWRYIHI